MASREAAIKNNLNDRARKEGQPDELTTQDIDALVAFYDHTCLKCGKKPAKSVDHVKPLSKGGTNTLDNLQLLCLNCNKAKGAHQVDYRHGKIFNGAIREISENGEPRERRHGGGRKPKEATILKRRIVANKIEEAEASFAFLVAIRDNEDEPIAQRLAAAESILDRVLGKPAQVQPQQGEDLYKLYAQGLKRFVYGDGAIPETGAAQSVQSLLRELSAAALPDSDTLVA